MFQNQYSVDTTRLPGWDYSSPGTYFVTICTKKHWCYFDQVIDGKMQLNRLGQIVKEEILKTERVRNNVLVDSWVIMPNHVHLIINITGSNHVETPRRGVSTNKIKQWKPGSLGVIINQIKGACTRRIRKSLNPYFAWQPRFYDHIIRTEQDLENLRLYMQTNPEKWRDDAYHPTIEVSINV